MVALVLAVIVVALILMALRGLVVMWLWNWLVPMILGLPEISFIESVGLVLLVSFLFGNVVNRGAVPSKASDKK